MVKQIKINGIRLNKDFIQVTQENYHSQDSSCVPLYCDLSARKINMVFMTMDKIGSRSFVSGTIAKKYFSQMGFKNYKSIDNLKICTISIYPHRYGMKFLGFLLELLGRLKLSFLYMACSNAMLTFVIKQANCDAFIKKLAGNFDLPLSHVPFEQKESNEFLLFLKKRYPECRATYVEKKIKTYGITLTKDLNLGSYLFSFKGLLKYGQKLLSMKDKEDKFIHTSAFMASKDQIGFSLLTGKSFSISANNSCDAELLSFYGPHFGDRHSIISRALNCLLKNKVQVLKADCTGASISIILPKGKGQEAKNVLMDVFEVPV